MAFSVQNNVVIFTALVCLASIPCPFAMLLRSPASSPTSNTSTPTAQEWFALNASVDGRLHIGYPWSKPCFSFYDGEPSTPNATECAYVEANTYNSHLNRSDVFGTFMSTQWETCMATGSQCELDWQDPVNPLAFEPPNQCLQGSISRYYINVQKPNDIIAAYNFSKRTNYPLVVKNTGHDVQGRSSAPNSLALWTHNLKHMLYNGSFVPSGCPETMATPGITLGAGAQFADVYIYANSQDVMVVGGADPSVGASGGWAMGGGHSALSPSLGLGVDRALEYQIVTGDGIFRIANACQNTDLFYALRGGGSVYGVVTEVTMRASPRKTLQSVEVRWDASNDINYIKILEVFLAHATAYARLGFGGYITPSRGQLVLVSSNANRSITEHIMQPLVDIANSIKAQHNVTEVHSFYDWFQDYVTIPGGVQDSVGTPTPLASRLIPQANHATAEGRSQLLNVTLETYRQTKYQQIHFTTPYGSGISGEGTSVGPAWRFSLWQVILVNPWTINTTRAEKETAYAGVSAAIDLYRDITPGSGAYTNEADIHEPNWQESFWGNHYEKLVAIKQKYDPDHLLDCWHCVDWKGENDPRYSCYI